MQCYVDSRHTNTTFRQWATNIFDAPVGAEETWHQWVHSYSARGRSNSGVCGQRAITATLLVTAYKPHSDILDISTLYISQCAQERTLEEDDVYVF